MTNEDEGCDIVQKLQNTIDNDGNVMVRLPLSRDGKVWTGRESCFWIDDTDEGYRYFNGLVYINNKWYVKDADQATYTAELVLHECPDSFEKLEDDLAKLTGGKGTLSAPACVYANRRYGDIDICNGCILNNDSYGTMPCINRMFKDILSRIHKLAAKEDK